MLNNALYATMDLGGWKGVSIHPEAIHEWLPKKPKTKTKKMKKSKKKMEKKKNIEETTNANRERERGAEAVVVVVDPEETYERRRISTSPYLVQAFGCRSRMWEGVGSNP